MNTVLTGSDSTEVFQTEVKVSKKTEGVDGDPQTSDPSNFNGRANSSLFIWYGGTIVFI